MKILVTGSAGFIGFHVAHRLLTDGHSVVGLDNINDYYDPSLKTRRNKLLAEFKKYKFYKVDIADEKKIETIFKKEKPETVVHLAAQAGVRYSILNPWVYAKSNYYGTLSIFEAAHKAGIKRVLYASSSSVYGKNQESPFKETHRTNTPMSLYAATKKANEVLAHAYNHLFGVDMVGFRFFTVYGPWGRPDMAFFNFVDNIQKGKTITLYNKGNMWRSFTYVDDVVEALVRFLEKKQKAGHRIYNIGGDSLVRVGDLIKEFENILDKKAVVKHEPKHIADVLKTHADTKKLKKDIGFVPKTSIKKGLKKFTDWYLKEEKWLSKLAKAKQ
jgi:UDP-glucuronate 4-epimerase